jgi:hypothetical protein
MIHRNFISAVVIDIRHVVTGMESYFSTRRTQYLGFVFQFENRDAVTNFFERIEGCNILYFILFIYLFKLQMGFYQMAVILQ